MHVKAGSTQLTLVNTRTDTQGKQAVELRGIMQAVDAAAVCVCMCLCVPSLLCDECYRIREERAPSDHVNT